MRIATFCFVVTIIITTLPFTTAQTYIPSEILDDYWAFYGYPILEAGIIGANQFEKGDNVTLRVSLVNAGGRINFESTKVADTPMKKALSTAEARLEWDVGNATGITGTLRSTSDLVEVKSGDQVIDSLAMTRKSEDPMEFVIKIDDHAPAGEYVLQLNLNYQYQNNVQVDAEGWDPDLGLKGFRVARNFVSGNQTLPLPIVVKQMADFEIVSSNADMRAGQKDGTIEVVYKNIGEKTANNSIARLSLFKPFTSTRDQAYIGTLNPGEEKNVTFKVAVDAEATPKTYGINSEIKYTDIDGDTIISESIKIPISVNAAGASYMIPVLILLILLMAAGSYMHKRKKA